MWGAEEEHPHCGRCSQCVDRRLSALAAELSDAEDPPSRYASDPLTGERDGPDLTLAERYVGVAREVARLTGPRPFAVRFPEVNAALGYAGCAPEEAARRCHDLYRRHAEGVERGISAAFKQVGVFDWQTLSPRSLLGIVQGRAAAPTEVPPPNAPVERGLVVDRTRFEVRLDGKPCRLGNHKEFAMIELLARRMGQFVTVQDLVDEVWDGAKRTGNAVHQVASNLRRMLRSDGLTRVVIDGSSPGHYCLTLGPE